MSLMPMGSWNLPNNTVPTFTQISSDDPIAEVIKRAFDMDLAVSGGWGYEAQQPIKLLDDTLPIPQLQHTLASMRTHLEMNLTQPAQKRYGGINLTEYSRDTKGDLEAVIYHITAIPELQYAAFIDAYKQGYGTEAFDMEAHFEARAKATLHREVTVWFRYAMPSS